MNINLYPRVVANSLPKSGTNLLLNNLYLIGYNKARFSIDRNFGKRHFISRLLSRAYRNEDAILVGIVSPEKVSKKYLKLRLKYTKTSSVVSAHCPYSTELSNIFKSNSYKVVSIIRDPRDVIVSHLNYVRRNKKHYLNKFYSNFNSIDDNIEFIIDGGKLDDGTVVKSIYDRYDSFVGWAKDNNCLMIRFEDLIGSKGKGSLDLQKNTVIRLLEFLNISQVSDDTLNYIVSNTYSDHVHTFRKGIIGDWRNYLNNNQNNKIKDTLSKIGNMFNYW